MHRILCITAASAILLAGCASKTQTGAVVGVAGGAVVGGAIGAVAGSTTKGVLIGAVVGGVAGTIIGAQMDKQAKELGQNIKGAKVERVGEGIQVTFDSGLLYDYDSDVVKPAAQTNLHELATSLEKYPDSEVFIVGHTDSDGSDQYNQALSERRARSAAAYLVSQGITGSRVGTKGLGETEPVASNDSDAGKATNRRVEVAIFASKAYRDKVVKANP